MKEHVSAPEPMHFRDPDHSLSEISVSVVSDVITASADIAMVLDSEGIIRDLALGDQAARGRAFQDYIGRALVDTAAIDSRLKVEMMLKDARASKAPRSREINHRIEHGSAQLTYRYTAVRLGDNGRVLALGRDLGAIAALQQELVGAQQAMDREYVRLHQAETRYRLLFQVSSEGVLIADATFYKVNECNPAACTTLGETPQRLAGRALSTLFSPETWPALQNMLIAVSSEGRPGELRALLAADGKEVTVHASLFRQANTPLLLIRVTPADMRALSPAADRASRALNILERMPDAFVIVDGERRILMANSAFLDIVQLANENQVRDQSLERWLGRPGVDLNILFANLREHGTVRTFATVMRSEFGATQEAQISAVSAMNGDKPCYGFMIRPVTSHLQLSPAAGPELPRSVEQLRGLVGRVALKEIVRESTDLIERLCIEAALEVSGDNRASAAQLLGLSRQSFYSKLRRHNLGDLDPGEP